MPSTKKAVAALCSLGGSDCSFQNFVHMVISPVARELGEAWVDDRLSFADVTIGVARLQTAVQNFNATVPGHDSLKPFAGRVFMASLSDTQHTLGASVAARAFSDAGWDVVQLENPDLNEAALSFLRFNQTDMIALGVGTTQRSDEAAQAVKRLREVAPSAQIYLAGPAVAAAPDLFADSDADIIGWDVFDVAKSQARRSADAA
ncbi:MAG: cobalamin B12-binding domain-containing protein [Pseudomonadota bacterium]